MLSYLALHPRRETSTTNFVAEAMYLDVEYNVVSEMVLAYQSVLLRTERTRDSGSTTRCGMRIHLVTVTGQ